MIVFQGYVWFECLNVVCVGDDVFEVECIFINVGGCVQVFVMLGFDLVLYLINLMMMDVDFLFDYLVIVGGSYVGFEFGQMYWCFGFRVMIIEKGLCLICCEDEDVLQVVCEIFEKEGIDVQFDVNCLSVCCDGDGIVVGFDCVGGGCEVVGLYLLFVVGCVLNIDDFGFDCVGVDIDVCGYIIVDDQLCINVFGIWVFGDCNGCGVFMYILYNDYEIVVVNLFDDDLCKVFDWIMVYVMYIDLLFGCVGMMFVEVKQMGCWLLVGMCLMMCVGWVVEKGESQGFMKVIVDVDSYVIFGVLIFGVIGDEVVYGIFDVMIVGVLYMMISCVMYIYLIVLELVLMLLQDLYLVE